MAAFEQFIRSADVMTVIFAFLLLEVAALMIWRWRTGRGLRVTRMVSMIVPGLSIFLALRSVLLGQTVWVTGLWLVVSMVSHLVDLRLRIHDETAWTAPLDTGGGTDAPMTERATASTQAPQPHSQESAANG